MARLIDANALGIGRANREAFDNPAYADGWNSAIAIIEDAPTVDAVEVVHGRWKYYHKQNIAVCTNCSFERNLDENFGKAVSCPNCGADMREVNNEC